MVTGQLQDKAENLLQLYLLKNSNPEILHIALKKISCTHFLSRLIKDDEVKITSITYKIFDHRIYGILHL